MTALAITNDLGQRGEEPDARHAVALARRSARGTREANHRPPARYESRRALLCLVAAGFMVAVSAVPASAQANPARVVEPASTLDAEMNATRRQADEARRRLERFLSSLSGRPANLAILDSLAALQQSARLLEQRLTQLQERANFRQMEGRLERDSAAPQGWFGVNVQTLGTSTEASGGRVLLSADYPQVVSVEPGSPAARAGVLAGDRLISIGGTDLRGQALDLRTVLRPGTRVPVQVERDGARRDVTLAITVRPAGFSPGARLRLYALSPDGPTIANALAASPIGAAAVRGSPGSARSEVTQSLISAGVWGSAAAAPSPTTHLFRSSPSVLAVAGAELMRLTAVLRESLGVSGGVYVISVAPRTPAEWAGLREGDIIQRADGIDLEAPVDFFRALQAQTDGVLRLELVRSGRRVTADMRW